MLSSSSSSLSSSSSINKQASFALSISPKTISTSWNPHTAPPRSRKSSILNLYDLPGPPPVLHRRRQHRRPPISFSSVGVKLPNVTLSYLNRNSTVQTVSLSNLSKGKRLVIVGVLAAFSPISTRFIKRVKSMKSKAADLIACIAANDVFVMKAWGENLGVGEKVMMLSHYKLIKPEANKVAAGQFQTALHVVRVGLAYMVMLAVMSFNGGVFLASVAGHAIGFAVFGNRIFEKLVPGKQSDLPPMKC